MGVAAARAFTSGATQAQAVARALAAAIALYGCPAIQPIISSMLLTLPLHIRCCSHILPLRSLSTAPSPYCQCGAVHAYEHIKWSNDLMRLYNMQVRS